MSYLPANIFFQTNGREPRLKLGLTRCGLVQFYMESEFRTEMYMFFVSFCLVLFCYSGVSTTASGYSYDFEVTEQLLRSCSLRLDTTLNGQNYGGFQNHAREHVKKRK